MNTRVVVTGMGVVSPVGLDRETTWKNLLDGVSGVDQITLFDTDGFETTIAAEVNGLDPEGHLGKKQARRMDRFVQMAVVAALEAKEQASVTIENSNSERVSVMIASGIGGLMTLSEEYKVLQEKGPTRISPFLVPKMLPDMASGQVSMLLGAKGPNYATVSACSSGADSLGQGFLALKRGDADIVFAGGSDAAVCPIGVAGFNACHALSKRNDEPQKASRPFDAQRDGFVMGEGAAVLVLETIDSAIEHRLRIVSVSFGAGFALFWHHVQKIDACSFEAWDVLQHADHFFHMALARIGNEQVPKHD